jgi:hypothetical protein
LVSPTGEPHNNSHALLIPGWPYLGQAHCRAVLNSHAGCALLLHLYCMESAVHACTAQTSPLLWDNQVRFRVDRRRAVRRAAAASNLCVCLLSAQCQLGAAPVRLQHVGCGRRPCAHVVVAAECIRVRKAAHHGLGVGLRVDAPAQPAEYTAIQGRRLGKRTNNNDLQSAVGTYSTAFPKLSSFQALPRQGLASRNAGCFGEPKHETESTGLAKSDCTIPSAAQLYQGL